MTDQSKEREEFEKWLFQKPYDGFVERIFDLWKQLRTANEQLEERNKELEEVRTVLREISRLDYMHAATNGCAYEAVKLAQVTLAEGSDK